MSANPNMPNSPIYEYLTLQIKLAILKVQYAELKAQVNQKNLGTQATIYVKDQGITKIMRSYIFVTNMN